MPIKEVRHHILLYIYRVITTTHFIISTQLITKKQGHLLTLDVINDTTPLLLFDVTIRNADWTTGVNVYSLE